MLLQLQNLLCVVIVMLVHPLYGMKQSKNRVNSLEIDFGHDEDYQECLADILKERYNDDVDKGKEAYRCHKCAFIFPQEKVFWMDHEPLCYECLYRFSPKTNIEFVLRNTFQEYDWDQFQEYDVDIAQILHNDISIPFKDSHIIPQILIHGFLCATSSLIYYNDFIGNFQDEELQSTSRPLIQLLPPIFFGYICSTSYIFAYHMYGPRMKHREIPFSFVPCRQKNENSKHLDTGHPEFQLFLSFLVLMSYLINYVNVANWLLHIIMFWSAFSLWYGRNSSFDYFGRYFSIFHEMQPQKWASIDGSKTSKTIRRMAYLEDKNKNCILVSNQLITFFNVVSSSILLHTVWNDDASGTKILFDVPIGAFLGANMVVWYTLIVVSIVKMVKNEHQPPLMTFNVLLRLIFAGLYALEITLENRYEIGIMSLIFVILSFLWEIRGFLVPRIRGNNSKLQQMSIYLNI